MVSVNILKTRSWALLVTGIRWKCVGNQGREPAADHQHVHGQLLQLRHQQVPRLLSAKGKAFLNLNIRWSVFRRRRRRTSTYSATRSTVGRATARSCLFCGGFSRGSSRLPARERKGQQWKFSLFLIFTCLGYLFLPWYHTILSNYQIFFNEDFDEIIWNKMS